jgi:hypothetical protein
LPSSAASACEVGPRRVRCWGLTCNSSVGQVDDAAEGVEVALVGFGEGVEAFLGGLADQPVAESLRLIPECLVAQGGEFQ